MDHLSELARLQIMRYLLVSNARSAVDYVLLPILLRKDEDQMGSIISSEVMNTLYVKMVNYGGGYDPVDGSRGAEDGTLTSIPPQSVDFLEFFSGHVLGSIASTSDVEAVICAKEKFILNQHAFQGLGNVSNLVDEIPMVLYRLLIGSRLQQMDERDLVKRSFEEYLTDCANKLQIPIAAAIVPSSTP